MKLFEKTLDSDMVYDGKIIKVYRDDALLPNGMTAHREVVHHIGAVAVLAIDKDENAYFVNQYRYPVQKELFEVPAGKMELGEIPLECAKRELKEECGVEAEKWTELGPIYTTPGFTDEIIWLFVAEELSEVNQQLDDDEFLNVEKLPLKDVFDKVVKGTVPDAKTQILVLRGALGRK